MGSPSIHRGIERHRVGRCVDHAAEPSFASRKRERRLLSIRDVLKGPEEPYRRAASKLGEALRLNPPVASFGCDDGELEVVRGPMLDGASLLATKGSFKTLYQARPQREAIGVPLI